MRQRQAGDRRLPQVKLLQLLKAGEFFDPGIVDSDSPIQSQLFEIGHRPEMVEAGSGKVLTLFERQRTHVFGVFQIREYRVAHVRAIQSQALQLRKAAEWGEALLG